jgi:hypothetical protein
MTLLVFLNPVCPVIRGFRPCVGHRKSVHNAQLEWLILEMKTIPFTRRLISNLSFLE